MARRALAERPSVRLSKPRPSRPSLQLLAFAAGETRCTWPIFRPGRVSRLAVEVEPDAGLGERAPASARHRRPMRLVITASLWRARIAERPAGNRPDVLLELRAERRVAGPVAGIVDPRSDLVDHEPRAAGAGGDEHLDREHADMADAPRRCGSAMADRLGGDLIGGIAAGTVLVARMPPSWTFSVTSKARDRAVAAAGEDRPRSRARTG